MTSRWWPCPAEARSPGTTGRRRGSEALARAGLTVDDIDLIEINEAFAAQVVPPGVGVREDRLNLNGTIAIGHHPA
ncbi:hypothetical protein ACQP1W_33180 [Spirillospora sp. CA-255316]